MNWLSSALLNHSLLSNVSPFAIGRLSSDSTKPRYVVPYTPKVDHVLSLYFTPCIGPCSNRCEVLPPIRRAPIIPKPLIVVHSKRFHMDKDKEQSTVNDSIWIRIRIRSPWAHKKNSKGLKTKELETRAYVSRAVYRVLALSPPPLLSVLPAIATN